jgi:hypothetical protein
VQAKGREPEDMKDFFISYNKEDKNWAEWIAWILEEAGYAVVIQAWDFRPGGNFVLEMQKAATGTQKTIAVLSEDYLRAEYTDPEWAAAFARDPQGAERTLIPMRVRECTAKGLLSPISYVDLVSLSEQDARIAILGAFSERGKPSQAPAFPGVRGGTTQTTLNRVAPNPVQFPGVSTGTDMTSSIIVADAGNTIETAPLQPRLTPQPSVSISQTERFTLVQNLHAVSAQQLNILIFTLNPPAGVIPPMPAPQGDRVFALLGWAEGPGGSGLAQVQEVLNVILNRP